MATKSDKGSNNKPVKPTGETPGKTNPKARKAVEEDDDEDTDEDVDIEKPTPAHKYIVKQMSYLGKLDVFEGAMDF